MYKTTVKFQNIEIPKNKDELSYFRETFEECIEIINTHYKSFENDELWKITSFIIEQL